MKNQCKKICYEWHNTKTGRIVGRTNCKYFTLKRSKPKCELYGRLKTMVTGEAFYLGRVINGKKTSL